MGIRLVQPNKAIQQARRAPSGGFANVDLSDPKRLQDVIAELGKRTSEIESKVVGDAIEYDVTLPSSGSVVLCHNFGCPIRWYVVSWKRKGTGGLYSLCEVGTSSTADTLVLTSAVPGQAVIRIEKSQGSVVNDDTTRTALSSGPIMTEVDFCAASDTATSTWTRVGARKLDTSDFSTYTVAKFIADIESTTHSSAWSVECRLFDVTNNVLVTSSTLSNSAESDKSLTKEFTATLTMGTSSGNIITNAATLYQVQLRVTGTITDSATQRAVVSNARLRLS